MIREKILEFIVPQLEDARLEEQRNITGLQLLDRALPQDYKAKPKRIIVVFVFIFLSIIISVLMILIRDFINHNSTTLKQVLKD